MTFIQMLKEEARYLKNQSGHHHCANIAIDSNFMPLNLLKQLMHAVGSMDDVSFWGVPDFKRLFYFLLEKCTHKVKSDYDLSEPLYKHLHKGTYAELKYPI